MRIKLTASLAVAYALMLAWQHINGGVAAHHLLARADLPSISNWWGLLSLPLLAWFLLGWIERRQRSDGDPSPAGGFACALAYGLLLALFFRIGRDDMCEYLVQGLPLIALVYPIYRAQCVLGFVLGMTHTFGPVLPIIAAAVLACGAYLLFHGSRLLEARVLR